MNTIYRKIRLLQKPGMFLITLPQIFLIIAVAGLLVLLTSTCIKFTKGSLSTTALKKHLLELQLKFINSAVINPELERQQMEKLQNKIKTSSDQPAISGDKNLQQLFANNCKFIHEVMTDVNLVNRSSWIKFRELMYGFNDFYFRA